MIFFIIFTWGIPYSLGIDDWGVRFILVKANLEITVRLRMFEGLLECFLTIYFIISLTIVITQTVFCTFPWNFVSVFSYFGGIEITSDKDYEEILGFIVENMGIKDRTILFRAVEYPLDIFFIFKYLFCLLM